MESLQLNVVASTRNSITLTWTSESSPGVLSRISSSNLLQRSSRHRAALTSDDRKISKMSLFPTSESSVNLRPAQSPRRQDVASNREKYLNKKYWFVVQRKDRLLGWSDVYRGFKTEVEISSLAPGDVHQFRVKSSCGKSDDEDEWSDILTSTTKDDVVSAASVHRAVDQGQLSISRKILALRPQVLEIPNKLGRSPLAAATEMRNSAIVSMLILQGADVNSVESASSRTPLMTAAFQGDPEILSILNERDASWSASDRFGQTPYHYAALNSQIMPLQLAFKEACDFNAKDNFGWTPLMIAVTMRAQSEVVEYILRSGADVNCSDKRGQTPLMQAILCEMPNIVKILIENGATTKVKNCYGHSAFDIAQVSKSQEIRDLFSRLEVKEAA